MHRRLSAKCIPLMRILTCTRVQSRFGEGLENRPEGCAGGCFVVGRTSEGKTWWPLVAAFIRGGTLRTFWDLSSLRSLFRPPAPFLFFPFSPRSFTCVHDDSTKRGRGFCKKKKKNFPPLRIIRNKKGTAFVGSFHLIFHDAGGKKSSARIYTYFRLLGNALSRSSPRARSTNVSEKFHDFTDTRAVNVLCRLKGR